MRAFLSSFLYSGTLQGTQTHASLSKGVHWGTPYKVANYQTSLSAATTFSFTCPSCTLHHTSDSRRLRGTSGHSEQRMSSDEARLALAKVQWRVSHAARHDSAGGARSEFRLAAVTCNNPRIDPDGGMSTTLAHDAGAARSASSAPLSKEVLDSTGRTRPLHVADFPVDSKGLPMWPRKPHGVEMLHTTNETRDSSDWDRSRRQSNFDFLEGPLVDVPTEGETSWTFPGQPKAEMCGGKAPDLQAPTGTATPGAS